MHHELTINAHWQDRAHKTQDKDKKKHKTTQKSIKYKINVLKKT